MKSIPAEAHPLIIATCILAALFIAALIRLWLLNRTEGRLLKKQEDLERQIVTQQNDLMAVRKDANAWRAEMQRQFDLYRHMASDQLGVEEKRFDDLLKRSEQRQYELQTALDIARQMCAELPAAKARVMQLESALGIDGGEGLSGSDGGGGSTPLDPMPDLSGGGRTSEPVPNGSYAAAPSAMPEVPAVDEAKLGELEEKLANTERQNVMLQQALTAARLRSRLRGKSPFSKGKSGKN